MPINFHDKQNMFSYSGRTADQTWKIAIQPLIHSTHPRVVDIGCGGGIYSKAWAQLGAEEVIGIDSSGTMIEAAELNCADDANISLRVGDALCTGLPDYFADVVFARALIHHLPEIEPFLREGFRILRPGGMLIIQDRTPDDVALPGSPQHIRGYFFERFPRLLEIDTGRRRPEQAVLSALSAAGFQPAQSFKLWETRQAYASREGLTADIRQRKGKSILHELGDNEIESLVSFINVQLTNESEIVEKDRWTVWHGVKSR